MNRKHLCLLSLCLLSGCCGDSRDSLMQEQFDILKEAAELLATVKDVESARKAKLKLRAYGIRMQELEKKEKSFSEITPEEGKRLREKFKDRAPDIGRFVHEVIRLELSASPEVKNELKDELEMFRLESSQLQEFMKGQKGSGAGPLINP